MPYLRQHDMLAERHRPEKKGERGEKGMKWKIFNWL